MSPADVARAQAAHAEAAAQATADATRRERARGSRRGRLARCAAPTFWYDVALEGSQERKEDDRG